MAVVLRLSRHGTKKRPHYRLVACDKDYPRDGRYLEILGTYNPKHPEAKGDFKKDRIEHYIKLGAKPTATVKQIIARS